MQKWAIGSIFVLFIFLCFPYSQGQEGLQNPGELYDSSMELYYKGNCEEAIGGFLKIIHSSPSSKLVSYSQYMIGLCYLKMGKYEEALQQFDLYLKAHPDGDRVTEVKQGIQISKDQLKGKVPSTSPPVTVSKELEMKAVSEEAKKPEVKVLPEVKKVRRRICAQVSYFEGKNFEEVEKKVKQLKSEGVDTLILRVFQNKGDRVYKFVTPRHEEGVYFNTEYAPVVDDILGRMVEIAHRNGLDLFAWMTTRYASYGIQGHPEYRCKSYNFETKRIEVARGFNLFHPDVLKRLEGLFHDLGRYRIDGILFQDDLILKRNEDFSNEANKIFLKEFGYPPHPDIFYIDPYKSDSGKYYVKAYTDFFWTWANWKNRWLMNVAQRLMEAARESNPNLQFAINLYFETILNASNSVAWFSQTLSGALEKDFDYYAIMAYHRQAMKNRNIETREAIALMAEVAQKAVKSIGDPSKVLMKVWILDWKGNEAVSLVAAPQKEIEEILEGILNHGEVSLAFVPYTDQFPLHLLKGKWTSSKKSSE
jgi:tetratricopeptide (TPR) repeat protein